MVFYVNSLKILLNITWPYEIEIFLLSYCLAAKNKNPPVLLTLQLFFSQLSTFHSLIGFYFLTNSILLLSVLFSIKLCLFFHFFLNLNKTKVVCDFRISLLYRSPRNREFFFLNNKKLLSFERRR